MNWMKWLFGPPAKDQFAASLIDAFRRAGDQRKLEYDKEMFQLKASAGDDFNEINLSQFYIEHCRIKPFERRGHIRLIAKTMISTKEELPESFDDARPNLRPKIWLRASFSELALHPTLNGGKKLEFPLYSLGEHLFTTVVYYTPTSMRSLSNEDLEKWGATLDEAMESACSNLETSVEFSEIREGLYSSISGDAYDPARILFKDKIRSLKLNGDPVAMVPQRDAIFVTGSEDEIGLGTMVELAGQAQDLPRLLSPIPLRLVDGEWEDWKFPKSHPDYEKYRLLECQFHGGNYNSQKSLLDAIHKKKGIKVFVASFTAFKQKRTHAIRSMCAWSKNCESLLPKTDLVFFKPTDEEHRCHWDDLRRVVGHLMEPVEDLYPIRYRVRSYPTDEQFSKIPKFEY